MIYLQSIEMSKKDDEGNVKRLACKEIVAALV